MLGRGLRTLSNGLCHLSRNKNIGLSIHYARDVIRIK